MISTPSNRLTEQALQAGLASVDLIRELVVLETTSSTNDHARRLARRGAPHGCLVVAEAQSAGRGRMGRSWHSPPGHNLYFSLVLRPSWPRSQSAGLPLLMAVAVAQGLEQLGAEPSIKWPNDVLLEGRKVAGVLSELISDQDQQWALILGVGINCNESAGSRPESLRSLAISVAESVARPVERVALLGAVLRSLEPLLSGFEAAGLEAILPAWRARWGQRGKQLRVLAGGDNEELLGVALDVAADGALLLDVGATEPRRIMSGDVSLWAAPGEHPEI